MGLISYAGTPTVLVSPTTKPRRHQGGAGQTASRRSHGVGRGDLHRLQAIATVGAEIGGGDTPPPARIVLFSDGKETVPSNPNNPKGAFTAARAARDQGIPISTISFGTPNGYVNVNGQRQPVPVDDTTMKKVAQLSGGTAYSATTLQQLTDVYATLQQQIGFDTIKGDASAGWLRLAALAVSLAALAALLINRRLPA